nr:hypothetical protein BaRGS_006993 [Batillaria attramentaria]
MGDERADLDLSKAGVSPMDDLEVFARQAVIVKNGKIFVEDEPFFCASDEDDDEDDDKVKEEKAACEEKKLKEFACGDSGYDSFHLDSNRTCGGEGDGTDDGFKGGRGDGDFRGGFGDGDSKSGFSDCDFKGDFSDDFKGGFGGGGFKRGLEDIDFNGVVHDDFDDVESEKENRVYPGLILGGGDGAHGRLHHDDDSDSDDSDEEGEEAMFLKLVDRDEFFEDVDGLRLQGLPDGPIDPAADYLDYIQ